MACHIDLRGERNWNTSGTQRIDRISTNGVSELTFRRFMEFFLFFSFFTCIPQGAIPTAQIVSIIGRAAQPIHVHSCLSRTLIVVIGVGVGMGEQGSNVALFIIHFHSGFEKTRVVLRTGEGWVLDKNRGKWVLVGLENLIAICIHI